MSYKQNQALAQAQEQAARLSAQAAAATRKETLIELQPGEILNEEKANQLKQLLLDKDGSILWDCLGEIKQGQVIVAKIVF